MKIHAAKANILPAIEACAAVADPRGSQRIHGAAILEAGEGVRFSATDGVRSIRARVAEANAAHGSVAVSAKLLLERVRAMPNDAIVKLEAKGDRLAISGGSLRYTLATMPVEEAPRIPTVSDDATCAMLPAAVLARAISRVLPFADTDTSRQHCGVNVELRDGRLTTFATDGHRLGVHRVDMTEPMDLSAFLPLAAARAFATALDGAEGDASIYVTGSVMHLAVGASELTTLLPRVTPPPWEQLVPARAPGAIVSRSALASAAKAVDLAADIGIGGGISFVARGGAMKVSAACSDRGEGEAEVDVRGVNVETRAKGSYMLGALAFFDGDEVEIQCAGDLEPIVLRSTDNDDASLALVMPTR